MRTAGDPADTDTDSADSFGVYVHVPFCAQRCDYCDFATWTDRGHLIDAYIDACAADIRRHGDAGTRPATSVFFGGGTPSLVPAEALVRVLDAIERADGAEVTVECNPDSVDPAKLCAYREAGVNRISLGVQSFVPDVLAALNRTHDPANVERAIEWARAAGFERISVDLIYGTPGESEADWRRSLTRAIELGVDHVSAYALTVEAGTPLGSRVAAGQTAAPDDDVQADDYAIADELLGAAGLEWYEVSNWARAGEECRHNLLYWTQGEYLGIGCAAHGHTNGRRWWNVRTPDRYIASIEAGASSQAGSEELDPVRRAEEAFTLAVRLRAGAPLPSPVDGALAGTLTELETLGLLVVASDPRSPTRRVVLTRAGRLLASDLTTRLLLAGVAAPSLDANGVGTR